VDVVRQAALAVRKRASKSLKPLLAKAAWPLAAAFAGRSPKRISAMLRVKNEEEYLTQAIDSIVEHVDELVVVDNLSDDRTPEIIAAAKARHPGKVQTFVYPHVIARYGEESLRLAATPEGRRSPAFLPNYYNWCAARCSHPYILKWDGDTVATEALGPALRAFRSSRYQVLWHTGINLHESRERFIRGRPLEDLEPRLFYRRFSRYENTMGYCEGLWSPYLYLFKSFSQHLTEPLYFHLKYCKQQRFSNVSIDIRQQDERISTPGDALPAELQRQVVALRL
jgi:glycosyltransferase involved in cell wall biosynthesis